MWSFFSSHVSFPQGRGGLIDKVLPPNPTQTSQDRGWDLHGAASTSCGARIFRVLPHVQRAIDGHHIHCSPELETPSSTLGLYS